MWTFCTVIAEEQQRQFQNISYCTKRLGSRDQVYQAAAVEHQSLRGWHPALGPGRLAHAQDLSAFQLVRLLNVRQGLSAQLGSMEPLLQVFALGFGGELALRVLAPQDILLTLATEMNFLLHYRGWKS